MISEAVGQHESLALMAVTANGEWGLGAVRERSLERTRPARVVIVAMATGQLSTIRTLPSPRGGPTLADGSDTWFAWAEASEQPNHGDWTIYAYDTKTRYLRRVAEAQAGVDGRYLPSSVWPQVDHGTVSWIQESADDPTERTGTVMAVRLPDGAPYVVAAGKRGCALSWPDVAYSEVRQGFDRIVRQDLRTGDTRVVTAASHFRYATISGEATAWIDDASHELWLAETPEAPARFITSKIGKHEFLQFPHMSRRFVTWQSNDYPGVYDRQLGVVVTFGELGRPVGWYFLAEGSTLVWLGPAGPIVPGEIPRRDYYVVTLP